MYRKNAYIVGRLAGLVVVLLMALCVAIQTPSVQTKLTTKMVQSLDEAFGANISYDKLSVMPSGALLLEEAVIIDRDPSTLDPYQRGFAPVDTLFYAERITATFTLNTLLGDNGLRLGRVGIEGGFFHLCIESSTDTTTNIQSIFKLDKPTGIRPEPGPTIFRINHVRIQDFHYRMTNRSERARIAKGGLDYSDMDVSIEKLRGHSLKFSGSRMYGYLDQLTLSEKSGYKIDNLKGNCVVGQGKALIENIHLRDPWSNVKFDFFSMSYDSSLSFKEFNEKILMEGKIKGGKLGTKSLYYFASGANVFNNELSLNLNNGHFKGYLNDFQVKSLEFSEQLSHISSKLSASVIGMPDFERMMIDANMNGTKFTTRGVQTLLSQILGSKAPTIAHYASGTAFQLKLSARGPLDRLILNTELTSNIGSLRLHSDIRNLISTERGIQLAFDLNSHELNLGEILDTDQVGTSTLYTRGSALLAKSNTQIQVDSLSIESAQAIGNTFRDITAQGSLNNGTLDIKVNSQDPKIKGHIDAQTILKNTSETKKLVAEGEFENIDLKALGIDKRDGRSKIALSIDSDIHGDKQRVGGHIRLNDIKVEDQDGDKEIGNLHLTAYEIGDQQCFSIESSFLDAFLSGSGNLQNFFNEIQEITTRRDLPALYANNNYISDQKTERYMLRIQTGDSREILSYIMPGLYVADSTRINISTETDGSFRGSLISSRLAYGSNFLKDVRVSFDNLDRSLIAEVQAKELMAAGMDLSNPTITAFADDNAFNIEARIASTNDILKKAVFNVEGKVYRDSLNVLNIEASPDKSYLATKQGRWDINEKLISLNNGNIHIDSLRLFNSDQYILIDGQLGQNSRDTLSMEMHKVDLSIIDEFTSNPSYISGLVNGYADLIIDSSSVHSMLTDIRIDDLKVGEENGGTLRLATILKENSEDIEIYIRNQIGERNALNINGSYYTSDGYLDISAALDMFPLALAKPFTAKFFSNLGGGISGNLNLLGHQDQLRITSEDLSLEEAQMTLAYTSVPYTISGPLTLDQGALIFDGINIRDDDSGTGALRGTLALNNMQNMSLNAHVTIDNLKLLDKPQNGGDFYGMIKARGQASINGPFNALNINANLETTSNGNIHIVASQYANGTTSDILTFTKIEEPEDPYVQMLGMMSAKEKANNDLNLRASVTLHPRLRAFIEIDKEAGNVVSFNGEGTASVFLRPSKDIFEIHGDYRISEGNYNFIIPGILSRNFEIQEASTIRFGGKIPDTQLDINALYKVRTSLSNLVINSSDVDTWRVVECGINISDRLSNPQLDFNIEVPDLDPTTKSQVETALATEDKVQKQFLSLLLLGSFLPDETSGVVNGSNILLSNMTELMSSQLNNILSKLEIPLDIGFDYQNAVSGNNMFDMAISTQLFNNRVIVGGSVGNRNYSTVTQARGDVVGDLDVQIKLDPEGKYRLNLFSHSADEFSSFLDYSQRNGVGVSFQKEYNNFNELLGNIFKSRKKQEEEQEAQTDTEKEQVIIKIDNEQRQAIPDTLSTRR